jgi:uncharacterized protein YjbI with pentapeptide repeats
VYERLAAAAPGERVEIVLGLIAAHPSGRLELPARDGLHAVLDEVDLGRPLSGSRRSGESRSKRPSPSISEPKEGGRASLRGADLQGTHLRQANLAYVDLAEANLQGAALGQADLRRARLGRADLRGADLAGARLQGALLGEADLRGAMLEEANLRGARLRFARLDGAVLEKADLRGADLWGAHLAGAELKEADLRGAVLREADLKGATLTLANLRGAALGRSDLSGAKLGGADLRKVDLGGACFHGARLAGAQLQGLDLTGCDIAGIHLSGTWLENVRLERRQLGPAIGEELEGDFDEARKSYLTLERAFQNLGDYDAASWAYRRRRRMQKREVLGRAQSDWAAGRWPAAVRHYAQYASDQSVEWLCDYGESVPRVLGALLALYLAFTLVYGLTGSVVRVVETSQGTVKVPTHNVWDLATFSLLAMSTSGSPAVGLQPKDEMVHFLTAMEALLGITLTGLLGFVLGNRIRR